MKLVRALIAAALAVAATVAFQLATSSNASAAGSPACIHCWGSNIDGD